MSKTLPNDGGLTPEEQAALDRVRESVREVLQVIDEFIAARDKRAERAEQRPWLDSGSGAGYSPDDDDSPYDPRD